MIFFFLYTAIHYLERKQEPELMFKDGIKTVDGAIRLLTAKAHSQVNTFNGVIQLLKFIDDKCTRLVTKAMYELQNQVQLVRHLDALEKHLKLIYQKKPDGHAGLFPAQKALYIFLSHQPWVRQVCEIGFNAGHSALFWLIGSNKTKLVSFDIAAYEYTKPMSDYLKALFPDRFETFWGDSKIAVPLFWQQKKMSNDNSFCCGIIAIDGLHTLELVMADLKNMRKVANSQQHLVILDDYPCSTCPGVGAAVFTALNQLLIKKYSDCVAYPDITR